MNISSLVHAKAACLSLHLFPGCAAMPSCNRVDGCARYTSRDNAAAACTSCTQMILGMHPAASLSAFMTPNMQKRYKYIAQRSSTKASSSVLSWVTAGGSWYCSSRARLARCRRRPRKAAAVSAAFSVAGACLLPGPTQARRTSEIPLPANGLLPGSATLRQGWCLPGCACFHPEITPSSQLYLRGSCMLFCNTSQQQRSLAAQSCLLLMVCWVVISVMGILGVCCEC